MLVVGVVLQGPFEPGEGFFLPLGDQHPDLQQQGLGLVGLDSEQLVQFLQRLWILLEFREDEGLGEQQAGIVRPLLGQLIDALDQLRLLLLVQLVEVAEQGGEPRFFPQSLDLGHVGHGLQGPPLAHQQGGVGILCLRVVRFQFHPEFRGFQCLTLPAHELGQVGGVGADPGIAQDPGLGHIVIQGDVVFTAAQGEFRHQQRVDTVVRKGSLRQFLLCGRFLLHNRSGRRDRLLDRCGAGTGSEQCSGESEYQQVGHMGMTAKQSA